VAGRSLTRHAAHPGVHRLRRHELRRNGEAAARIVRALDDAQLDSSATIITGRPPLTAQQVTERILIGHVRGHLATVRTAIGGS
jgi:hypothetical protein